jgi:hypothetical protein
MKTTLEMFIEANLALTKCYEAVPLEKYNGFSAAQKADLCRSEREAVSGFLNSGKIGMANLIKERLASAGQQ